MQTYVRNPSRDKDIVRHFPPYRSPTNSPPFLTAGREKTKKKTIWHTFADRGLDPHIAITPSALLPFFRYCGFRGWLPREWGVGWGEV
jgi:hypothetical protein